MTQLTLTRAGRSIRLSQELGRGGEGTVFAYDDQRDYVAKIYSIPPDKGKVEKLTVMVKAASPALLRIAAWPTDLLADNKGVVRGFVMPRGVARRNIHELYGPKSRSEVFPDADFRFLTHVCANVARAFAVVHEHGHVIGDVNHGNLLVGPDGTVMLIDCDSFQVSDGSKVFTCNYGVDLFTAPELQGRSLRGLVRSANHDHFGLAVLVFHLLFMGRHPFAGRYCGPGEMPIERAIAECRFAYGPDRALNLMERPPGTIPLETMGATIAEYFVRAYSRAGSNHARPDAKAWVSALESLKSGLQTCSAARWHQYPSHLSSCPWCVVEAQTAVRLFGHRIVTFGHSGTIDIESLWQAITALQGPGPDPTLPSDRSWTCPPGVHLPSQTLNTIRHIASLCLALAGLLLWVALLASGGFWWMLFLLGLAVVIWPRVSPEKRFATERAYSSADAEWKAALKQWRQEASADVFKEKLRSLERARADIIDLPNERARRLAKLDAEREMRQKLRYLDRFRIDLASIRGIGPSRTAMLAAYGIETAADVENDRIRTYAKPSNG